VKGKTPKKGDEQQLNERKNKNTEEKEEEKGPHSLLEKGGKLGPGCPKSIRKRTLKGDDTGAGQKGEK